MKSVDWNFGHSGRVVRQLVEESDGHGFSGRPDHFIPCSGYHKHQWSGPCLGQLHILQLLQFKRTSHIIDQHGLGRSLGFNFIFILFYAMPSCNHKVRCIGPCLDNSITASLIQTKSYWHLVDGSKFKDIKTNFETLAQVTSD